MDFTKDPNWKVSDEHNYHSDSHKKGKHKHGDEEESVPVVYNVVNESWFRFQWRPMMAWVYMAICLFDFIIAPTAVSVLITFYKSTIPVWTALTLASGGLIHVAFGAILGVTAWGRTKEREYEYNSPYGPPPYGTRYSESSTTFVASRPLPPRPVRRE